MLIKGSTSLVSWFTYGYTEHRKQNRKGKLYFMNKHINRHKTKTPISYSYHGCIFFFIIFVKPKEPSRNFKWFTILISVYMQLFRNPLQRRKWLRTPNILKMASLFLPHTPGFIPIMLTKTDLKDELLIVK